MAGKRKSTKSIEIDPQFYSLLEKVNSNISSVRDTVQSLDKKLDLHIQKTEFEFAAIRELDLEQNAILEAHHDRSIQLKRDNDLKEAQLRAEMKSADEALAMRVESLEGPRKWFKQTWTIIFTTGVAVGGLIGLVQFYRSFHP